MEQRLSLVTVAVGDLARSRRFYEKLGWKPGFVADDIAFYQLNGLVLGLWSRAELAKELKRPLESVGVAGISLAQNLRSKKEVDAVFAEAKKAGATVIKAPVDTAWGGYSGYFADPDGHPWELAWNPAWTVTPEGATKLSPP